MTAGRMVNSQSINWCTPPKYVEAVKKVLGGAVELDPCSNQWSIVGAKEAFSLPERNGLAEEWNYKTIYVNPPYGADRKRKTTIKHWLYKCAHAHKNTTLRCWRWSPSQSTQVIGKSMFGAMPPRFVFCMTRALNFWKKATAGARARQWLAR